MDIRTADVSPGTIPGLIWAYRFAFDGSSSRIPDEKTREAVGHPEGWVWIHLNLSDPRAEEWIGSPEAPFPKGARDILLSTDSHAHLDIFGNTVAGMFADLRREAERDDEDIGFLRFALNEGIVVSARHRALHSVKQTRLAIEEGRRLENAVGLLEAIVEKFADAAATICEELADAVNLIEDRIVSDKASDERRPLAQLRRRAVRLHRQLIGLHTLFVRLDRLDRDKVPPALVEAAHRLASRLDTLHHDLHSVQERARLLQEEVAAKVAEQTNRLLYIISILTAVFVPPTFVTGIFGMNTKGLIFTDSDNAFVYAMLMCVFSATAVYAVVKWVGRSMTGPS